MKFYLMRHGQTSFNKNGLIQGGISDIDLTIEGIHQAETAIDVIKSLNIQHICCGTLLRQIHTAEIVNNELNHVAIETFPNFNEISFGEFEGKEKLKCFSIINERLHTNITSFHSDSPIAISDGFYNADSSGKAESAKMVANRFMDGIHILEKKYSSDSNILIVSSGMAIGCFIYEYCQNPNSFSIKNCSIEQVTNENGQYVSCSIFKGV